METSHQIDISDYDGSGYDYTSFWKERQYEDRSEKNALGKLLPKQGEKILDLGGGYGRLSPLYIDRYKQSIILDYSQNLLDKAHLLAEQKDWKNLQTKRGDVYQLPFGNDEFDTVLMVRVLHHLEKPQIALKEIARVLQPGGVFILEFANKIHLKRRIKHWTKRNWGFTQDEEPTQFDTGDGIILNYHPKHVQRLLKNTGFRLEKKSAASNLRLPILKKFLPLQLHLLLDSALRLPFSTLSLSPSLIYLCRKSEV